MRGDFRHRETRGEKNRRGVGIGPDGERDFGEKTAFGGAKIGGGFAGRNGVERNADGMGGGDLRRGEIVMRREGKREYGFSSAGNQEVKESEKNVPYR